MILQETASIHFSAPEWDLSDLYDSPESPSLAADLVAASTRAKAFCSAYEGCLARLDGAAMGAAIAEYESICELLCKASSFAQLMFAAHVGDPEVGRFHQLVRERTTDISAETLFFTLQINKLDDAVLERMLDDPATAHYGPWLRDVRVFRPHQLSDEVERMLHERSVTGSAAWSRLSDETLARLRFPVRGEELPLAGVLNNLSSPDRSLRRDSAKAVSGVLEENIGLFSLVTNTLAKDKGIDDGWRSYPRPVSFRNLCNLVEDEVVDALSSAVRDSYGNLSHRYYKLKASWLGAEVLDYWDRNAPLPDSDDTHYTWLEARDIVLSAYGDFSPEFATIAKRFFDGGWIDAAARPDKNSGAFSHSTVPSVHPYILMNFHGRSRDVATLAHELGHGVHQVLAGPRGTLMSSTPLILAETASVFGEMLTFRTILERADSRAKRRSLLAGKVEDMLNTVVRQVSFYEFERQVHEERRSGELLPDRIGDIWMDTQKESLGPAFRFDAEYRHYWAYIPHFIHTPFYVYAYAFGDCLVNALYDVFQDGHPGFQAKYQKMLSAGGTLRHKELLAPFGLDASAPAFWHRGLSVISRFIDELESDDGKV